MSPGDPVDQRSNLEQAIVVQESLRGSVDDSIIDAAIASIKAQLETLDPVPQQRKLATVLFMDIAGHTALTVGLDPEEQMAVVDPAIVRLAARVDEHGGRIARYQGDGFKAVFGLPVAQENDTRQAVRAGLAIQVEAAAIAAELDAERGLSGFQVRVGITTGMVFAGGETEGEDTIKGPPVNLAARLESAAEPGTILISRDTFSHVRGIFDFEPRDPIQAKGFSEPVPVFRVLRAKPRPFYQGSRGVEGVETSMVGRDGELKLLQDACELARLGKQAQVVTLVGEAGLGKSRLLQEFETWVDLQPEATLLFRGRAAQEVQAMPYGLLRSLLAFRMEIQDDDPPTTVTDKLQTGLSAGLAADSEIEMKVHFIGHFSGFSIQDSPHLEAVRDDAEQLRNRAVKYLVEYFESPSQAGLVMLLLEDLHWADDSSLDVITEMVMRLRKRPLLVVSAARPSLYARRAHWGEGQAFHTRIDLRPLSKLDGRRLLGTILQRVEDLPDTLRDLVVKNAEGNPFYLEELVKMLIEQGAIEKGEERWTIMHNRLDQVLVPQTLTSVLQGRLDRLGKDERVLLQQAAVVGRIFWDLLLVHLQEADDLERGREQVMDVLESLRGREMVFRRETSAFGGAVEHTFKHDLLRAVVYESVLLQHRRKFHGLIAEWFITRVGEERHNYHGLIADHLIGAGSEQRAVGFIMDAAESATRRYAIEEALAYYDRILALPESVYRQHRWAVYCGREKVLDFLGNREEQYLELMRMQSYAGEVADPKLQVEVGLRLLNYSEATRNYPEELETARATLDLAWKTNTPSLEARALLALGRVFVLQGADMGEAKELLASASDKFVLLGDYRRAGYANRTLGVIHGSENDERAAIKYTRKALELAQKAHDHLGEVYALTNLSGVLNASGDWQGSLEFLKQSHLLVKKIGNRRGEAYILGALASRANRIGNFAQAEDYGWETLMLLREIGDQRVELDELINLSRLASRRKSYEDALNRLKQATALVDGIEVGEEVVANLMDAYCEVYTDLAAYDPAVEYGIRAIQLRKRASHPRQSILSRAILAAALLGAEKPFEAKEQVDQVLRWLEEEEDAGQDEESPRILLVCFKVLAACSDPRAAELLSAAYASVDFLSDKIDSAGDRRSFLENVPWNRETVALWEARNQGRKR